MFNLLSSLSKETTIYGNLKKGLIPISKNFKNINVALAIFIFLKQKCFIYIFVLKI